MQLTISYKDDVHCFTVTEDMELENLIAYCEAEIGESFDNLLLVHSSRPLNEPKKTLKQYNIKDNDILAVTSKQALQSLQSVQSVPTTRSSTNSTNQSTAFNPVGEITLEQASRVRESFLSNPDELSRISQINPELSDALLSGSVEQFRTVLVEQYKRKKEEETRRIRMMNADPFDVEAQQMIADEIRRQQIETNMHDAIEFMPEAFGQVHMLYIKCKVNGFDIDAFVDSGAQSTIMSKACADRCNVTRLIDNRWSGIAQGVGTQKILGRIHMCQIQIEKDFLPCSFSVLEQQPMDMLLGLDMLKRHQCVINLKENVLKIGTTGSETKFLGEAETKHHTSRLSETEGESSMSKVGG